MVASTTRRGILVGMTQIVKYTSFSEETILYLIREAAFPAKKTKGPGGTWVSNTDSIDEWSRFYVQSKKDV